MCQPGTITTIVGQGTQLFNSSSSGRATSFTLGLAANGVAADDKGNVFFAAELLGRIDPAGNLNIMTNANYVNGVVVDSAGQLYFECYTAINVQPVCRLATDGTVTVLVDPQQAGLGPAFRVATTDASNNLYLVDPDNSRILKVAPNGIVSLFAGAKVSGKNWDGTPSSGLRTTPYAMAFDLQGNAYVIEGDELYRGAGGTLIKKITPSRQITLFAGNDKQVSAGDGGPAASASFTFLNDIATDRAGNLYVIDAYTVRRIAANGIITKVAGTGDRSFSANMGDGGPALSATFAAPSYLTANPAGDIFVADTFYNVIRKIAGTGAATTAPVFDAVVNTASGAASAAKGSWVSIYGTNLAKSTAAWDNAIIGGKLPTSLAGVQVFVGASAAPAASAVPGYLSYVSPTQINVLLPESFTVRSDGQAVVTVMHDGFSEWSLIPIADNAPGWFTYPLGVQSFVAALFANEATLVAPVGAIPGTASRPAKAGDIISLYATGLSALPNCPDGVLLTQACLIPGTQPTVGLGGLAANVLFAGMIGPGLFQVNVLVPAGIPAGTQTAVLSLKSGITQAKAVLAFQ
jgi:uncharacterized protein (TIGR03437 family)